MYNRIASMQEILYTEIAESDSEKTQNDFKKLQKGMNFEKKEKTLIMSEFLILPLTLWS